MRAALRRIKNGISFCGFDFARPLRLPLVCAAEAREILVRRESNDCQWMVANRDLLSADPGVREAARIVYRECHGRKANVAEPGFRLAGTRDLPDLRSTRRCAGAAGRTTLDTLRRRTARVQPVQRRAAVCDAEAAALAAV